MPENRVSYRSDTGDVLLPEPTVPSPETSGHRYRAYGTRREATVGGPTERRARLTSAQSIRSHSISLNDDSPSVSVAEARVPVQKGRLVRWAERLAVWWARSVRDETGADAKTDRIQQFKSGLEDSLVGFIAQGLRDGNPDTTWRRNVTHYLDLLDGEAALAASGRPPASAVRYQLSNQEIDEIVENVANRVLADLVPAEVLAPDSDVLETLRDVIRRSGEPRLTPLFRPLVYRTLENAVPEDPSERTDLVKSGLVDVLTGLAAEGLKGRPPSADMRRHIRNYLRMLREKNPPTELSDDDRAWIERRVADRIARDIEPDGQAIATLNTFFAQLN